MDGKDEQEEEKEEEKEDGGGKHVDEKRRGWLPNSNLGVGRVGKWAQCGVTLREFALSPSTPLPTRWHLHRTFSSIMCATLYFPRFNLFALSAGDTSSSRPLSPPLSLIRLFVYHLSLAPSKPDRSTLIDLLILTIVLCLPVRTSFLTDFLSRRARNRLGETDDFSCYFLFLKLSGKFRRRNLPVANPS